MSYLVPTLLNYSSCSQQVLVAVELIEIIPYHLTTFLTVNILLLYIGA